MAIFLMFSGIFYMAMPLTAAASTFYSVHSKYEEEARKAAAVAPDEQEGESTTGGADGNGDGGSSEKIANVKGKSLRIRDSIRLSASNLLEILSDMNEYFDDLQRPSDEILSGRGFGDEQNSDEDSEAGSEEEEEEEERPEDKSRRERLEAAKRRRGLRDPEMQSAASSLLRRGHALHMALDLELRTLKVDLEVLLEMEFEGKS